MNITRSIRTTLCALALALIATPAFAQKPTAIPIRAVSAPFSTSATVGSVVELREIDGGKVLVNDSNRQQLLLFDAMLQHAVALADTQGAASAYPRFGKLIPYTDDSSLFYDADSRSLVVIDNEGKFGRVLSLPHPSDFNSITSGGLVSTDGHGHLIYQGRISFALQPPCRPSGDASNKTPATTPNDSLVIIRADFETRTVDTIARARTVVPGLSSPQTTKDANCNTIGATVHVNPSLPLTDSWTVTSRGTIAIVRGHDYHIDWINSDGTRRSTPKMPFDWRRLTDADKQAKVDSARRIIDSLTARGGYRLKSCMGGRSTSFSMNPPSGNSGSSAPTVSVTSSVGVTGGGGVDGSSSDVMRGSDGCETITVRAQFVPLDSMADYVAPIREKSALADMDGNVWILPTTTANANGGLLYDVVNPDGELFERVQLPADRIIAGFGRNSIIYLIHGERTAAYAIEKVKVVH